MRFSLLLWLITSIPAFAQSDQDQKVIADFKNDLLYGVPNMRHDTLRLPPYTLERVGLGWRKLVKTFDANSTVVLYEYFYTGTTQLESSGTYTLSGAPVGITKTYAKDGTLNYMLDFDKGEWTVYNKEVYLFCEIQHKIKMKADSLVARLYGPDILKENLVWDIMESYMYNKNAAGRWTDQFKSQPTSFLITYNAKLDNQHKYHNVLRLRFDEKGNLLPDSLNTYLDCEEGQKNWKGGFRLSYNNVLLECKKLGLIELESTKIQHDLKWENFEYSPDIQNQFRFYLTVQTKVIEEIVPEGRCSRTTKYDRYSFDPLTGNFLEKKKLKIFEYWTGNRQNVGMTGFVPDKD